MQSQPPSPKASAQHMLGPWFNTSQDDTPMGEVMDQPLDSEVTLHISISGPDAKAAARLIAAAPELLAAAAQCAMNVLELMDKETAGLGFRARYVPLLLRAAILKATEHAA